MTITNDEELLIVKVEDIKKRESKAKEIGKKLYEEKWCKERLGKCYRHTTASGADDDCFEVFRVLGLGWHDTIRLECTHYHHDEHYGLNCREQWSPDSHNHMMEYYDEISSEEYDEWVKFLLFKMHKEHLIDVDYWEDPNAKARREQRLISDKTIKVDDPFRDGFS